MKKAIISFILIICLVFSFASCKKSANYSVLEVGGYDNLSNAKHQNEIELESTTYKKLIINPSKEIKINGNTYKANYKISRKSYLFKDDVNEYEAKNDGVHVMFWVNNNTGKIDMFWRYDFNYANNNNDVSPSDREQCLDIATKYLDGFIDANEYTLIDERYSEDPQYDAIYTFYFVRVIDGIQSSDKASIYVTSYGDVISHHFTCLGELKNAKLPSEEDIKLIESNIGKKVYSVYDSVSERFNYSYEIKETFIVKLPNGKHALDYYLDVKLEPKNQNTKGYTEFMELLVYID